MPVLDRGLRAALWSATRWSTFTAGRAARLRGDGVDLRSVTEDSLFPTAGRTARVAVLAFPDRQALPRARTALGRALNKLVRVGRYKRNARTPAYMRQLAADMLGHDCELVDAEGALLGERPGAEIGERIAAASELVLLWPDATGYGWRPLERRVFALRRRGARVFALSGRRRYFELTPAVLASFRVRRVLERFWLGEILLGTALLLAAPALVAWDFARGRR
jgi:hypothetical protein